MRVDMTIEMTFVECANCGIPFCITSDLESRLRKCHNNFYCPKGHVNVYSAETEEEKLRKQLAEQRSLYVRTQGELDTLKKKQAPKRVNKSKKVVTPPGSNKA
jgi:hypothetical protein